MVGTDDAVRYGTERRRRFVSARAVWPVTSGKWAVCRLRADVLRNRWWVRAILLIAGMLVMVARAPTFFLEPRFWAEEGTRNFAHVYSTHWTSIFSYNFRGYFSLFDKIAALLAVYLVDLRDAPLVTTLLALVVQAIPLALVLWSDSRPWDTLASKLLGVSIVLFTPLTGEIWLNTVNSTFYLALATFLVLLEDSGTGSKLKAGAHMFILALAGLTGVVACFLTPLFALKAWVEKTRRSYAQLLVMMVCTLTQLVFLLLPDGLLADRGVSIRPRVILSVLWIKTVILPLFGPVVGSRAADSVNHVRDLGDMPYTALSGLLLAHLAAFWGMILWRACSYKRLLIVASYFTVSILSIVGSTGDPSVMIDEWSGQRYFYVPSVLFLVLMLDRMDGRRSPPGRFVSFICAALILSAIITGIVHYQSTLIMSEDWPKWRQEIARWEQDPGYTLRIWPEGWQFQLEPRQ